MRMPSFLLSFALAGAFTGTVAAAGHTQTPVRAADRAPRFLAALTPSKPPQPIDVARTPVLRKRISLNHRNATLAEGLAEVSRQAGLQLMYSRDVVPLDRRVALEVKSITVAAALTELLLDVNVDVLFSSTGQAVLVRRTEVGVALPETGTIVGRVTDAKTGTGLGSVEVFLRGARWRTTTDTAGRYRLAEVDTGTYTLAVRRFGYAMQSRPVTVAAERTDTVDVALEPVATRLNELVTTATGQRRRLDVANDVTTINADSVMQTAPIRSVTDLLDGRVPGLTVQRTSGAPGDPARLRLRGAGSPLRSNDPIVVVDGVRVYAEQSAARSANLANGDNGSYATPSPLDYIDPNSIETIEVLKGPSAATLYGQDAANGVIVITTKKGHAGPTQWAASAEHGRTHIPGEFPDLLLRWGHWLQQDQITPCPIGDAVDVPGAVYQYGCSADSVVQFQLLNDPALTMLGAGHRSAVSLGASGGSSALTYAVTGTYQDETGSPRLPTYEAERYQTRIGTSPPDWMQRPQHLKQWGITSRIGTRLGATADLTISTRLSRTNQQRSSLEQQLGTLMATYVDKASGLYYTQQAQIARLSDPETVTDGLLTNYYQRATDAATQFTNGLNLNWRPRSWFTVTADAGLDLVHRSDELFLPRGAVDTVGHLNAGQGTSTVSTVNVRGNALAPLGHGFNFRFALGANYTGTSTADQTLQTSYLPAGTSLEGTVIDDADRTTRDDATFGWYAEPSIGNEKFNFSSGLRLDGGSSYGGGVSGLSLPKFPKLGLSYLLSDESWFPFKDQIQSFRLRVGYGRASRQPGIADRLRVYTSTAPIFVDGTFIDGVYLASLGNTQLRPERSTELEGGFDVDFLDSRFSLSVSGYRKTTDDALLPKPVPPSVYGEGVNMLTNIGRIRNTGLEMNLDAQLVRSGPITWGANLQLSRNRNVVVNLGAGIEPFYTESEGFGRGGIRVAAGYPLFGRWSKPILGYADANGDGVLQREEILVGDTAVYVGQTLPNYTASLHTTVSLWRGAVTVNAGFTYDDGLAQVNTVAEQLAVFSHGRNDSTASLAEQAATAFTSIGTDYNWIQTVNTVRFSDLAVTYRVPTTVARRLGAQRLDIAVQGGNLGLWTNYRGLDPNVNARATGNDVIDTGVLPQLRTWQVRVNATY